MVTCIPSSATRTNWTSPLPLQQSYPVPLWLLLHSKLPLSHPSMHCLAVLVFCTATLKMLVSRWLKIEDSPIQALETPAY